MIKKDDLEEFLFLYSRLDIFPFTNYEDALVSNYNALDIPFKNYSETIIGRHDYLKIEISENLLNLKGTDKLLYLNFVSDKLKFETFGYNEKNLVDLLKDFDVNGKNLDFNKNKGLKELLHTSFKLISGNEKLEKLKNLNNEYCHYLLDIERTKIIKHVNDLIEGLDHKQDSVAKKNEDYVWFKVGLLFAKGEVQPLFKKYKSERGHFKKITVELGFKETDRNYFSETINNTTNHQKNIYRDLKKMKTIHDYCVNNKIVVNEDFISVYKALQEK